MEVTSCVVFFFFQAEDGIRDIGVDWSSDVCSSDLAYPFRKPAKMEAFVDAVLDAPPVRVSADYSHVRSLVFELEDGTEVARFYEPGSGELYLSEERSEERRVGKERRSRWSPYH